MEKTVAKFRWETVVVEKATAKQDANFALIGRFDGGPYKVISMHRHRDGANPTDVHNERWTNIKVATRIGRD